RSTDQTKWPVVRRVRLPFQAWYVYWLDEDHLLVDGAHSKGDNPKYPLRSLYKVPIDARNASKVKVVSPKKYAPRRFALDRAGARWLDITTDSLTCWKIGEETPIWMRKFPPVSRRNRGVVCDDGWVLVHDMDRSAFVFDLNDGTELWRSSSIYWTRVQDSYLLVGDKNGAEIWKYQKPQARVPDNSATRVAPVRQARRETLALPPVAWQEMCVSPDGQKVVAPWRKSNTIAMWDLPSGKLDFVFQGKHSAQVF
ncbi:unnamed protein product, partial [marine sediment metagenome]